MIYLVGTLGLFGGFMLGQMILAYILRAKTKEELMTDKSLRTKYGALNWAVAFGTAACSVWLYLNMTAP